MEKCVYVETPCGGVQGLEENGKVNVFKGIRYARARRFSYPVEITGWDGIYDACRFGSCAPQEPAYVESKHKDPAWEFFKGQEYTYDEDCLFLNLWAPKGEKDLPVIVYIHGGGFKTGYSYDNSIDGSHLCKNRVILVTINYRVGPLGFLALRELADAHGHCGNYGLMDQMAALSWVKHNIRAFGGNPDQVTVMGQSAGAMSVQLLCLSPLARGLFNKAVMISGGGVSEKLRFSRSMESQQALGKRFMEMLELSSPEQFKTVDVKQLYLKFGEMWRGLPDSGDFCVPAVDGWVLPKDEVTLAKSGDYTPVPTMIGATIDDILPQLLMDMAKNWAGIQNDFYDTETYVYQFCRSLPGDSLGAWHCSDLWYIFGTLEHCWRPFGDKDRELSNEIICALADFAAGRAPKNWTPYRTPEHIRRWL